MPRTASPDNNNNKITATTTTNNSNNDGRLNAELEAALLRGVTMRPSGKWQAQIYYAGKSRYIGVFAGREKAATAYVIVRQHLGGSRRSVSSESAMHLFSEARTAAFKGVEGMPDYEIPAAAVQQRQQKLLSTVAAKTAAESRSSTSSSAGKPEGAPK